MLSAWLSAQTPSPESLLRHATELQQAGDLERAEQAYAARTLGELQVRADAGRCAQVARGRLEVADLVSDVEHAESGSHRVCGEDLVADVVCPCHVNRRCDEVRNAVLPRRVQAAEDQAAALDEQGVLLLIFELPPQLMGSPNERHVGGSLADGEPGDPRLAMR